MSSYAPDAPSEDSWLGVADSQQWPPQRVKLMTALNAILQQVSHCCGSQRTDEEELKAFEV